MHQIQKAVPNPPASRRALDADTATPGVKWPTEDDDRPAAFETQEELSRIVVLGYN